MFHYPTSFIHRPLLTNKDTHIPDYATLMIQVIKHIPPPSRKSPYQIECKSQIGAVKIVFFGPKSKWIAQSLTLNESFYISGKIETFNGHYQVSHPDYISKILSDIPEFEPIYPLTHGLNNKILTKTIRKALSLLPDNIPEWIDETTIKQNNFPSFKDALQKLHSPQKNADLSPNSTHFSRLAYDELLANQISLYYARHEIKHTGNSIKTNSNYGKKICAMLPFELTDGQKQVLQEIKNDMASEKKMLRLLQGDVGSGKTIVSVFAMLEAVEAGYQAVLMAPTDILSRQHFKKISELLATIGLKVILLTGREKGKNRLSILDQIKTDADIIIGTHALFSENVIYRNIGLVVIDEQHRFGVKQRLLLSQKGQNVDILSMTATPIPRSLALTYYGDMDISVLKEKPKNRIPIQTSAIPITKIDTLLPNIQNAIREKKQIYWVCPLIEESEKIDLANAQKRYQYLSQYFHRVGLLHGKMKSEEKDKVMNEFLNGNLDILVSTTVIEVGVDVPNASIMFIEQAERFGLSTLHQLRGRIGRGNIQSNCILLYGYPISEQGKKRIDLMRKSNDGFEIAEQDLILRGGGEVLGIKQSGITDFIFTDLSEHMPLLYSACQNISATIKNNDGQIIKALLLLFNKYNKQDYIC